MKPEEIEALKERLREEEMRLGGQSIDYGCVDSGIGGILASEAADAIEALQADNARLREALERISKIFPEWKSDRLRLIQQIARQALAESGQ